jgi:hypothetical protein
MKFMKFLIKMIFFTGIWGDKSRIDPGKKTRLFPHPYQPGPYGIREAKHVFGEFDGAELAIVEVYITS